MRLFLDTEWNNDAARELVSIALVSEDGTKEFYSERDPLPEPPASFSNRSIDAWMEGWRRCRIRRSVSR